jgi:fumarate hydratase, class I
MNAPMLFATGNFGPTAAGRMDGYVADFQAVEGSMVMRAKGNRARGEGCLPEIWQVLSRQRRRSRGSSRAGLYPRDRGARISGAWMEAVWRIEVENFPAFIATDDKGNDFFEGLLV